AFGFFCCSRRYRFRRCANRNGEPRCSRNSIQCCSGMDRKTFTTSGSNWLPEHRLISSRACGIGSARRYGRSLIMASSESAMVKTRGTGQNRQIGIRNRHGLCNGDAERGNTLAMALGFRVLQVQRAAKGLQSVVVRLFELVESLLEPRGAIFHLLLEIALIFSVFVDEPTMLQRAAHAQE